MEWAYELINGYKSRRRARDEHRPQQPQHRRADRQPRRLRGLAQRARRSGRRRGRGGRRHRVHRRPPGRVPAQELPRRRHRDRVLPGLRRPGRERRRPEPQLRPVLGRPRLGHEPGDPDLPRPGAVLRARVAQRPVARLPQPGDDADHQPHDRGPRAARARPGRDRRPGRREPRLQGARRRRWPSTTATSARRASSSTTRPGTTEDWSYNATGGYGFTFEIYCGAPELRDRRLRRPGLPPALRDDGQGVGRRRATQADHVNDPGPNAGFDGQGNREAYYLAAESTINEARHSVLEGTAPAGTRLRLTKDFKTETYRGRVEQVDDHLETVYDVGASGHVPLAREPVDAADRGQGDRRARTAGSRARRGRPAPAAPAGTADDPDDDGAAPGRRRRTATTRPATTTTRSRSRPTATTRRPTIRIQWPTIASDWDMRALPRTRTATASLRTPSEPVVGTSAAGHDGLRGGPRSRTRAGQAYVLRVDQLRGGRGLHADGHLRGPAAVPAGAAARPTRSRCERDGAVLATQPVLVERGEVEDARRRARRRAPSTGRRRTDGGHRADGLRGDRRASRSVGLRPQRHAARGSSSRRARAAAGHRVRVPAVQRAPDHRRAAASRASRNRTGSFTWNGKRAGARDRRLLLRPLPARRATRGGSRCGAATGGSRGSATSTGARRCDLVPSYKLIAAGVRRHADARARDLLPASRSRRG